jgi:hypothetical protein
MKIIKERNDRKTEMVKKKKILVQRSSTIGKNSSPPHQKNTAFIAERSLTKVSQPHKKGTENLPIYFKATTLYLSGIRSHDQ